MKSLIRPELAKDEDQARQQGNLNGKRIFLKAIDYGTFWPGVVECLVGVIKAEFRKGRWVVSAIFTGTAERQEIVLDQAQLNGLRPMADGYFLGW